MTTTRVINYKDNIYIDVMNCGEILSIVNASEDYTCAKKELYKVHHEICTYGKIIQIINNHDGIINPDIWPQTNN